MHRDLTPFAYEDGVRSLCTIIYADEDGHTPNLHHPGPHCLGHSVFEPYTFQQPVNE